VLCLVLCLELCLELSRFFSFIHIRRKTFIDAFGRSVVLLPFQLLFIRSHAEEEKTSTNQQKPDQSVSSELFVSSSTVLSDKCLAMEAYLPQIVEMSLLSNACSLKL